MTLTGLLLRFQCFGTFWGAGRDEFGLEMDVLVGTKGEIKGFQLILTPVREGKVRG